MTLDTLRVIEEEPERLIEVPGLGPKRTAKISAAWEEQKAIKEVMVFLQGVGVSTSLAIRIYKNYQDSSISVVKNEPYRLASDVWGIGFKTADKIAQSLGIPPDSPERIKAGLQYTLSEAERSVTVRERVRAARAIQARRFASAPRVTCNAEMGPAEVREFCEVEPAAQPLLRAAMQRLQLSARAFHRVLKLARTIADLAGAETIAAPHLAEALQYRPRADAG